MEHTATGWHGDQKHSWSGKKKSHKIIIIIKKHPKNHSKADKKNYINIGPKVHTLLLPKDGKETPGKTSLWDMGGQSPCEQCYLLQTVMITLSTSPCALGSLRARQQTERSNSAFQLPTSPALYCCPHSYGHVVQFRALQDSSSA